MSNPELRRILILGSSGSGKSTLANQLGVLLGMEVIHLDSYYWQPFWTPTPKKDWEYVVDQLLQKPAWVMDGNYLGSLEKRLRYADSAIFLDIDRTTCLWRCFQRLARHWGKVREELPEGCVEKMDWEFFRWIWDYPTNLRPRILQLLNNNLGYHQVFILRSHREINDFLVAAQKAQGLAAPPMP